MKRFEQLLRPAYEARAAVAWGVAVVWCLGATLLLSEPKGALAACTLVAMTMCALQAFKARRLLKYKVSLAGKPVTVWPTSRLVSAMPHIGENLFLGWGYRWEPTHTQRAYEVMKRDLDEIYPPAWWLRWNNVTHDPRTAKGLPWIHGLDMGEENVQLPMESLKGHCAIVATTGAIKTRLAALIISQLAMRGECVIVIDPKGDKDLREICRQAAIISGDPNRFLMLHPAFASESVRLDLLKNWDRVSQVASRISMVLDSEEDDNFKQFCWMAVHQITNAMKYTGRRVSIDTLKTAMMDRNAVEKLTQQALTQFYSTEGALLKDHVEKEINAQRADSGKKGGRGGGGIETSSVELTAMIKVFQDVVPEDKAQSQQMGLPVKPDELRGLVTILSANREWFGKMIVSITPMLTKLTTDDLKGLLSPDYEDIDDPRPIMDGKRIVEGNHILYIGTDTLADESVGKAIAAMTLAELSAVAAEIYNHGLEGDQGKEPRRIHVLVDEAGDAVCAPLIQQANKGRGAGMFLWVLFQTFNDLVVKFGNNAPMAKKFMGNMNNLIVGATQDPDTMDLIVDKLGETVVSVKSYSTSSGSKTEDVGLEFSANTGTNLSEQAMEVFPRSLLPSLPDLHYIGFFNRGQLFKGRIPVLVDDEKFARK